MVYEEEIRIEVKGFNLAGHLRDMGLCLYL